MLFASKIMEQIITVFGIDWKLMLAQAVNFAVVLFVLERFLYRPVLKMIDERRKKIEQGVKDAEFASHELQKAETKAHEIISKADIEARGTLLSGKKIAEEKAEKIEKDAEEKRKMMIYGAIKDAEEMKRRAIEESREEVAKLGILAAEKVLRSKLS